MIVNIPGVGRVEFPEGTPPEVIEKAARDYLASQPKQRLELLEQAREARKPTLVTEGKDPMSELVRQLGYRYALRLWEQPNLLVWSLTQLPIF